MSNTSWSFSDRPHGSTISRSVGETQFDNCLPWKCPKHSRSRALASTFLEVGETDRPRFPPVYSAILGAGYSRLHFSDPLSLSLHFLPLNTATFVCLFVCFVILAVFFSPVCPLSISPTSLKTYMKVTLNSSDTFRQLLRYPMLLSTRRSDSSTYLKKPWCNPLPNFTFSLKTIILSHFYNPVTIHRW